MIAAVVLAAGSSRRFGADNKLLVDIDGRPLVERVILAIEQAGVGDLVVVTGHEADRITKAVVRAGRRIVHNGGHGDGIGSSIAIGAAAVDPDADGILIAQGDMPELDSDIVVKLIDAFGAAGADRIVCPAVEGGRQGNPVIWPRRLRAALMRLHGDRGGKRLIEAEGDRVVRVPVAGRGAEVDIDTPGELAAYLAARSSQPR